MRKEFISKEDQSRDALLIALSGGVIGIIGAIAESSFLSQYNIDIDSVIKGGGATLAGIGLSVGGLWRFVILRRSPTKVGE